jgi:hypothetical protein
MPALLTWGVSLACFQADRVVLRAHFACGRSALRICACVRERTDRDQHDVPCFSRIASTFVACHVSQDENKQRNLASASLFLHFLCARGPADLSRLVFLVPACCALRGRWTHRPSQCIDALDFLDMQELKESSPGKTILACFSKCCSQKKEKTISDGMRPRNL